MTTHTQPGDRSLGQEVQPRSVTAPGIALGIGLGGFVDGIVFHQVLQWHHMLSSSGSDHIGLSSHPVDTVRGLEVNTLWDGFFHVFTWVMVVVGVTLLVSRTRRSQGRGWTAKTLSGWVLVGWGVFNLVEGLVDHHLLAIHHVRPGEHQLLADLLYLAAGGVLVVGGWLLQRSGSAGRGR